MLAGKNSEIKRATVVQAVVMFFSVPRLEWCGEGSLFELDWNKRWEPKFGHYLSYPGPLLKSGLGQMWNPRRP